MDKSIIDLHYDLVEGRIHKIKPTIKNSTYYKEYIPQTNEEFTLLEDGLYKDEKDNKYFYDEERKVFAIAGHLLFVFYLVCKKSNSFQPRTVW